jgi:signal transduction histidine kinase/ActR/RegA family two-component response regulator
VPREPLLIVDDDPFVLGLLVHVAESRGLAVVGVASSDEAVAAAGTQPFGAAIVDLQLGADSGLDVIKRLRALDPTLEAIVISADRRLSSAIESIDLQVFAFLPKPLDPDQVFVTAERALERRRDAMERRRLTSELALLNELAEIVTGSLELGVVLQRALERVGLVFGARWGAIRLRADRGATPETRARIGPAGAPLNRMQPLADAVLAEGRVRRIARGDGAAMAALRGWPIVHSQGRSCDDTGLCGGGAGCLVQQALDGVSASAEITTPEGRIFAITTLPVPADRAAVLVAKEVTEERAQARRLRALSDELSATNVALTRTVEQLQDTQAQLVQSGKLSAIGELVAGVAHELNNPLTSIIGYAQLVEEAVRQVEPEAPMLADLEIVMSEAERAARIVRNLLTFARRQSTERAMTSLRDVCERVESLRAYDRQVHHIASAIDVPADLPPVWADATHLQQALLNLVINAEHAVAGRDPATITFTAAVSPEANAVTLSVIDSGSGIAPDDLPRVFDPFFTTRSVGEGTGLGLSITYGIVRDHGGEI